MLFEIEDGVLKRYEGDEEHVVIPDGISEIDEGAFKCCRSIKRIFIPESVKHIGSRAFEDCRSLKTIKLPDTLKYIKSGAFKGCSSLESITIPKNTTQIAFENWCFYNVFSGCESLKSITVEPENPYYYMLNGMLIFRDEYGSGGAAAVVKCLPDARGEVKVPEYAEKIAAQAFENCRYIERVVLPESVTEIHDAAFEGCINLKESNIPSGIEFIGKDAFKDTKIKNAPRFYIKTFDAEGAV